MKKELNVRQISLFFITFVPVTKLILMPSVLAGTAGEDLYISVLITSLLEVFTAFMILAAYKKHKTDFFNVLSSHFGKTGKAVILVLYFLYFTVKLFSPLNEQKEYVHLTLYETAPTFFSFAPFFLVAVLICVAELRTLGRLSDLLFPLTVLSIALVFGLSIQSLDFTAVMPVGANGIKKIITASYYSLNWFGDAVYLLFFIGNFEPEKHGTLKIILSYSASLFVSVLFALTFYLAFGPIAERTQFALTDISKYSTVINNIGRIDYCAIFAILGVSAISLSLPMFFQVSIIKELFSLKKKTVPAVVVPLFYLILTFALSENFIAVQTFIQKYLGFFFLFFSNVFPSLTYFLRRKNVKS